MKNYETDKKVITGKVRFNFVNLFYPRRFGENNDTKYSLCLLIEKGDTDTLTKIAKGIDAALKEAKEKWGEDKVKNIKNPLQDGDKLDDIKWEFIGKYYLNTSSRIKPGIVDKDLKVVTDPAAIFSGCYGRASIKFYPYKVDEKVGIGVSLNNVQLLEEGDYLGNRATAEEDFAV